ncbi:hypothetical protein B296_00014365 [Ensete ventricosum]|uniref:Cytochrome P450 n=1 Tax=Ensete ventricosum TaxID=4639 RepID=A0A427AXU8_ENSVE|nr:hypothetical protein B296_00014365 [Ensete ventricosum]
MWICKRNHQRKIRGTSKKLPPGGRSWPLIGHGLKWYMAVASSHPPKFVEDQVRRELVGRNGVIVVHGEQQRKLHGIAMDMMRAEKLNLMNSHFLADMQMVMVGALSTLQENHVIVAINLMVNQLLGVSTESEIGEMARLFSDFVDGCLSVPINLPGFTYCTAMRVTSARPEKLDLSNMQTLRENGVLGRLVEEENLPDDVVSDFIINLLFAGNETTAKTMLFALYFLTHCPDALEQVQVIDETLRLGGIAIWLLREAKVDIEYQGLPSSSPPFLKGKEVREYTNLNRKWGKGKDKIDDEDITFQRMVAKLLMLQCTSIRGSRGMKILP